MKVMNGLVMSLQEDKKFICGGSAALFCRFANGGAKISIKSYFINPFLFFSVYSATANSKITSIWSKLPTAAFWSREEKIGNYEANLLYVESDFGITDTRDKPFTVFFAR